jgi:histidyl-tRNA synthetase
VLTRLNLFPESFVHSTDSSSSTGEREANYLLPMITQLRRMGICCELYPGAAKMKKQLSYADRNHIPFVVMVGENEMKEEKITLKNMQSGDQKSISPQRSSEEISKKTTVCTADNIPKRKLRKFRSFLVQLSDDLHIHGIHSL